MQQQVIRPLSVVGRDAALGAVRGQVSHYINTVAEAYLQHAQGLAANPKSAFLRIPDRRSDRAIALPAFLASAGGLWGMKWISSVPANSSRGIPRASGVVILNDAETGFPFACVEASVVNAVRTAASAALGARYLSSSGPSECDLGIVGTGYIAEATLSYLLADGWTFRRVHAFDSNPDKLADLQRGGPYADLEIVRCESAAQVVEMSDMTLFATTSTQPYIDSLPGNPTIIHLSLRDIGIPAIRSAQNIVDDVDMCLTEQTSLHLTEQALDHRDFVDGNIVDLMTGLVIPDTARARVFSPFGMGILDVAVAHEIYRHAEGTGRITAISDFFG